MGACRDAWNERKVHALLRLGRTVAGQASAGDGADQVVVRWLRFNSVERLDEIAPEVAQVVADQRVIRGATLHLERAARVAHGGEEALDFHAAWRIDRPRPAHQRVKGIHVSGQLPHYRV
jgi:hypothetical protein